MNKAGDLRTNAAEGPNAVTWGVFPGKEVIQPTVVDGAAFLAWKDEAFELGSAWADLYEKTSAESAKVIRDIFSSFYLVNVVANDYRDPDDLAIFRPFFSIKSPEGTPLTQSGAATPLVNGDH